MTTDDAPSNGRPPIPDSEIIERFGGIRPMASKLGVAVTTVQGWKERGHIPANRYKQISASAAEHGIELNGGQPVAGEEHAALSPPPDRHVAPEKPESPAPKTETVQAAEASSPKPPAPKPPEPKKAEPPAPEPARPAKAAPVRRSGGGIAWIAFALAIALLAAMLTRPWWEPAIHRGVAGSGPGNLDQIAGSVAAIEDAVERLKRDSEARSGDLTGRVTALEAGGGEAGAAFAGQLASLERGMSGLADALQSLTSSLRRMEQRLADLEAAGDSIPAPVQREISEIGNQIEILQSEIELWNELAKTQSDALANGFDAVGARLTELETRPLQTGEKIAAMALAIGQVEAALNSGKPYRAALNRLEVLGRDDPLITSSEAIAVLSPWADYGIPDRLALHRRFAEITPQIDRALASVEEKTWLDSVWNSVKGLVTVRRIDGDGDLSPVSVAALAMERGDLDAAAAAFAGAGSLGPEGNAWLNLVTNRIDAEREIRALYGRVIAPLADSDEIEASAQ